MIHPHQMRTRFPEAMPYIVKMFMATEPAQDVFATVVTLVSDPRNPEALYRLARSYVARWEAVQGREMDDMDLAIIGRKLTALIKEDKPVGGYFRRALTIIKLQRAVEGNSWRCFDAIAGILYDIHKTMVEAETQGPSTTNKA